MSKNENKPKAKEVGVKLIAPHTHHGVPHKPGDTIQVRESRLPWLTRHGLIDAPANATKE